MIILYGFSLIYVLWIFFLAVMNLKRARDSVGLTLPAKILGYPLLFVGLVIDFLTNIKVMSVLFLEVPRETLVTARLKRHIQGTGWRQKLALWFCVNLLDKFDPSGNHCS